MYKDLVKYYHFTIIDDACNFKAWKTFSQNLK